MSLFILALLIALNIDAQAYTVDHEDQKQIALEASDRSLIDSFNSCLLEVEASKPTGLMALSHLSGESTQWLNDCIDDTQPEFSISYCLVDEYQNYLGLECLMSMSAKGHDRKRLNDLYFKSEQQR